MLHLVPPQPVLVELGEAVDHNWDGQGEDEDSREGTETPDQLAWEPRDGKVNWEMQVLPRRVRGLRSYPTVVMVIRPHLGSQVGGRGRGEGEEGRGGGEDGRREERWEGEGERMHEDE